MSQYDEMLKNMPAGLDRAVLRIIGFHRGKIEAIGGEDLTRQVQVMGFAGIDNRTVREAIKELRRSGQLIFSMPGEKGGYYLARDMSEYENFKKTEYVAKIKDMSETLHAMDKAAREQFGDGVQERLF